MSSRCLFDPGVHHAAAVKLHDRGVLILGRSGSGKSSLAIELISRGGSLISDDRVTVAAQGDAVHLSAPAAIAGLIEARGVGILRCPGTDAFLSLVVDLDKVEKERLPPERNIHCAGQIFPLIYGAQNPHLAGAIWLYAKYGRSS